MRILKVAKIKKSTGKKRLAAIFISAVMSLTVLTSCNESGNISRTADESAHEKKPVEINVVTSYGGDDGNRHNYEAAFKAYEAESGNIVHDSSSVSSEEWKNQVMKSFADGNEPDVLFYFTGVDANRLIEDGKLVSIDTVREVYPDYASNMDDDMLPVSPFDGKCYAVPVNGYWEGLFVNKKVLADCGVEVPDADTTWDEFISDCRIISEKGYIPIAASLNELPHYWFEFCVFNHGNIENHTDLPETPTDLVGQKWSSGLNDIKFLFESGFFPSDTGSISGAQAEALMTSDKAAFMIEGSWKMGWFAENAADINNFTVTFVPGKGERKTTDIIGGISMGYFITEKAWNNPEKQAACVEFITALTEDDVVASFGTTAVTALKNGITPPADAGNLVKDALIMTGSFTGIAAAAEDGLSPKSRADLFENVMSIAEGKITAEQAIEECLAVIG